MRIPYVIDNQQHLLAAVLNEVLAEHMGRSLDVATAYLECGGLTPLFGAGTCHGACSKRRRARRQVAAKRKR